MLQQLLDVLTLEDTGNDGFLGHNMHPQGFRVYGGQVLAQALAAAQYTVDSERAVHSQHAYFLREGKTDRPIQYQVERARDGGSFSSRRVVASQDNRPILVCSLSFQLPDDSFDFQEPLPGVRGPEELLSERERALASGRLNEDFMITTGEDLDVRMVVPVDWRNPEPRSGTLFSWMKTTDALADDPALHRSLLTYFSDTMLLDAGLVQHGRSYWDRELQTASLDHAIWFHADFRADQWLLHSADLERNSGGRTLIRGRFYTREGKHVATVMQQGLMRKR
ncbi:acyl-CoA thioesterase II [Seongchinamella unica]|uniref:Acyl-CoA thioesterase II n=1 Tax=Seongchinamella unica TaxID=2547392 RepID=A0A4R5LP31_9GAMM|nr:acyl-CoA thioesterase domain-containing protein [Seongchinamella unica]TDG12105.1 acyl-CoA thioesterase II [Seongchinamella unica]